LLHRKASDRKGGDARSTEFWALKGINLSVGKGEILGVVGRNGAGKSTLLMTLAGIFSPNRGRVEVQGRIGTLLSLGAGFHNELSGRENIQMNALFMGLNSRQIAEQTENIVEFADIGEFIDAPLKTYSSGMRARLGFAIACTINHDVLLIDEVFEAGDEAFKKKSGNLLQRYRDAGCTIVMASHNLNLIQSFCERSILLHEGRLLDDGPSARIMEQYRALQ